MVEIRMSQNPRLQPAYDFVRRRLRESRVAVGMTQADVARSIGRPQSFVSKIETKERRVDFVELQVFAAIYGQPLSYFVYPGMMRILGE